MGDKGDEKTIANEDVLAKYKAAAECVNRKFRIFHVYAYAKYTN